MNSSREKRHNRMRARILKAARKLVHASGFNKLSLRAIAREVDYSPAGLYEYFPNKDAIIDSLCEQTEQQLVNTLELSVQQNTSDHPLVAMGLAYISFANQNADDFQLLFQHAQLEPSHNITNAFMELVEDAVDNGEFLPGYDFEDEEMAHSYWAMAHGIAMLALTREQYNTLDDRDVHREILQRLLLGLRS